VVHLRQYDIVRVVKLIQADRPYDGTESVRRPPKVGDVATICHEYDPKDTDRNKLFNFPRVKLVVPLAVEVIAM